MGTEVEIPDEWYETFAERAPEKGFDSTEEYIHYVLQQIYEKLERQDAAGDDGGDGREYSEAEAEQVKDRLRGLGYLE